MGCRRLNCGDLLLGEGYRLIAESGAPADVQLQMLRIASRGHRTLCLGQGAELCWERDPKPMSSLEVLQIFRQKTALLSRSLCKMGASLAARTTR